MVTNSCAFYFAREASVTGLDESIPIYVIHLPGTCFCPGSAQGRRLMGFVEDRSANLRVGVIAS